MALQSLLLGLNQQESPNTQLILHPFLFLNCITKNKSLTNPLGKDCNENSFRTSYLSESLGIYNEKAWNMLPEEHTDLSAGREP